MRGAETCDAGEFLIPSPHNPFPSLPPFALFGSVDPKQPGASLEEPHVPVAHCHSALTHLPFLCSRFHSFPPGHVICAPNNQSPIYGCSALVTLIQTEGPPGYPSSLAEPACGPCHLPRVPSLPSGGLLPKLRLQVRLTKGCSLAPHPTAISVNCPEKDPGAGCQVPHGRRSSGPGLRG